MCTYNRGASQPSSASSSSAPVEFMDLTSMQSPPPPAIPRPVLADAPTPLLSIFQNPDVFARQQFCSTLIPPHIRVSLMCFCLCSSPVPNLINLDDSIEVLPHFEELDRASRRHPASEPLSDPRPTKRRALNDNGERLPYPVLDLTSPSVSSSSSSRSTANMLRRTHSSSSSSSDIVFLSPPPPPPPTQYR